MTDDVMKELVTKHDLTISHLVSSVEHLVQSQTVTNERLEEISKFLAKQVVFGSRLDDMDRNVSESFKRVHDRIDEIDTIQKSVKGCNSLRLLTKDVETITKDVTRLVGNNEEHRLRIEQIDNRAIPKVVLMWIIGIAITYTVMFGTYTVQTFNKIDKVNTKLMTLIERDVEDVRKLMEKVK